MKLSQLLASLPASMSAHALIRSENTLHPDAEIAHLEIDSRAVTPGTLFVALVGERFDAHQYIEQAVERGAVAVLVMRDRATGFERLGVPVLSAQDTRAALGPLAAAFYGDPSAHMTVLGVTGTNGKTTTTYLLEALLSRLGRRVGVFGTVNYRWGRRVLDAPNTTPESLTLQRLMAQMLADGVDTVLMEVSSHGLATHRVDDVRFDVALYTNLTQDHLDFHGTMEAYAQAKARLFTELLPRSAKPRQTAILNLDDPQGRALYVQLRSPEARHASGAALRCVGCSLEGHPEATGVMLEAQLSLEGVRCRYKSAHGRFALRSPLLGRFNVSNLLQALMAIEAIGIDLAQLDPELLCDWPGVPGRLERVWPGSGDASAPAVFVDYAHTPDALARALEALKPYVRGDLWVVFGCGGDRDQGKRPLMGQVAAEHAQAIVLTSDNPRREDPEQILDQIQAGIKPLTPAILWRQPDRRLAIEHALRWARHEDVVLVAGKGHETYQERDGQRSPFDDRLVAADALRARGRLAIAQWSLEQIAQELGAQLLAPAHDPPSRVGQRTPRAVTTDSRGLAPGDLFVALRGDRFDGHDFLPQAAALGAVAAIVSASAVAALEPGHEPGHEPDHEPGRASIASLPLLVVQDPLLALQQLGRAVWQRQTAQLDLMTIAVTGSNGKTTTKELLRALWHHRGLVAATAGNLNNEIGLPLTLCALPQDAQIAILEMGAGKPGDIAQLIALTPQARLRVITSIGAAHLERLGGLDGVRRVKAGLLEQADPHTWAIVPHQERERLVDPAFLGQVLTFGAEPDAHVRVLDCEPTSAGQRVTLAFEQRRWTLELPLVGQHHAHNLAAAFATLIAAQQAPPDLDHPALLRHLDVPGGRWRVVTRRQRCFIDDAYNANPTSMVASFQAFIQWQRRPQAPTGTRIAVLGPMLELGHDAKIWHERVIRSISEAEELEVLIVVGPDADALAALASHTPRARRLLVHAAHELHDAAALLQQHDHALIFLKASRGARLERVLDLVQDGQGDV